MMGDARENWKSACMLLSWAMLRNRSTMVDGRRKGRGLVAYKSVFTMQVPKQCQKNGISHPGIPASKRLGQC